jgi:hypothetical protein
LLVLLAVLLSFKNPMHIYKPVFYIELLVYAN